MSNNIVETKDQYFSIFFFFSEKKNK